MSVSRRSSRVRWLVIAALCATFTFAASAAPAHAERFAFAFGHDVVNDGNVCTTLCISGRTGSGAGEFKLPALVANVGNELFVSDVFNFRMSVFDSQSGAFNRAFGIDVGGPGVNTCTTSCQTAFGFACAPGSSPCQPLPGLFGPLGVAAVGGQLFIAEANGHRVSVWDAATGTFVRAYGKDIGGPGVDICTSSCPLPAPGGGAGQLESPFGVAVVGDDMYVSDQTKDRVSVFSVTSGHFLFAFGKNVGGTGHDTCTTTCHAGTVSGNGDPGEIGFPRTIAVSDGKVFVDDYLNNRVSVFNAATGEFIDAFGTDVGGAGSSTCTTTCHTGGLGDAPGNLAGVEEVSVSGNELFVSERVNRRISVFDVASEHFLRALGRDVGGAGHNVCTTTCQRGSFSGGAGEFGSPEGTTVVGDNLVVADAVPSFLGDDQRLVVINATTGDPVFASGRSVLSDGGTDFEICRFACQAGRTGSAAAGIDPFAAAADGGKLFVADEASRRVSVYDALSGELVKVFGKDVGGPGVDSCTTLCQAGTPGDDPGDLDTPTGIAITAGQVYVSDGTTGKISVFDESTGAFVRAFGTGNLTTPANMTVVGGELFVADANADRVAVFNPTTGAFLRALGKNVGGTGINVCTTGCHAGVDGEGAGELKIPLGIAVSGGEVFLSESDQNHRVSVFDATDGTFLHAFGAGVGGPGINICTTTCHAGSGVFGDLFSPGGIDAPAQMAIAGGEVFIADQFDGRVSVFNPTTSAFVRAFAKDVGGPGVDTCTSMITSTCTQPSLGAGPGQLSTPTALAISGNGIYVGEVNNARISVFTGAADVTAPDTTITAGPTGLIKVSTATFSFTSSETGSSFECRVDSAAFKYCTSASTTAPLDDGPHTFQVRAIDAAWNADASPASRSFTVDAPPETTITAGPSGPTNNTTPTFSFTSSKAGSTFECRIDTGSFRSCTSPRTTSSLRNGRHTFQVRATDKAGATDPTPASRTFTIDTTPPRATITAGPNTTNNTTPAFSFTSSEAGSTFQCRVDAGAFTACTSPYTTAQLAGGSHTFEVRATDPAGNTGQPASRRFTIDLTPPQTTIIHGPGQTTSTNPPTFYYTSSEDGSTFQCRVDTGTFTACGALYTTARLSLGPHTFEVRATDRAGNTDPTPATSSFTITPRSTDDRG